MISASARFIANASMSEILDRANAAAMAGAEACGQLILDRALQLVPRDTGELAGSGHLESNETQNGATTKVVFDSDHAAYVEFGTGIRGAASPGAAAETASMHISYSSTWPGMPAQPYLRPALDESKPEIKDTFGAGAKAGWLRLG